MILPRFLTALVGAPILLISIYYGQIPYLLLVLAIIVLSLREFFYMASMNGTPGFEWFGLIAGTLLSFSIFLNGTTLGAVHENQGTGAFLSLVVIASLAMGFFMRNTEELYMRWGVTLAGILYVGWSLGHLFLIRDIRPGGMGYCLFLFIVLWANDIFSYFVGKKFGTRPLAPQASPKKTVEGAVGGAFCAMIIALICQRLFLREHMGAMESMSLGVILSIAGTFSDISESLLKRSAGVKDSSAILPGHGGILDRFDVFVVVAPLFYYYIVFFKNV